jgi:glutathione S-transferase
MAKYGTLTYFVPVRSRGEPTQLCIAYGGVDMDVELISMDEWGKRKAAGVAPFLPYITQADGTIMLETTVIMKHIGTVGGKFVVDAKQDELCQISNDPPIQHCDPTFNLPGGGGRDKAGQPAYDEWFQATSEVLKVYVAKLGDGPFFAGAKPGYAECFVWHNLDNCFAIDKTAFTKAIGEEAMGKLTAFYDRFAALDGVKEYLARRLKVWGFPGSRAQPTPPSFIATNFTTRVAYDAWLKAGADPAALP